MDIHGMAKDNVLSIRRWSEEQEVLLVLHFGHARASVTLPAPAGRWHKWLDSADERWHGPGSPLTGEFASDGEASLTLPPEAIMLFGRARES
jgi:maltooligosyltrehalose trehalohydrolase